MNAPTSFMTRTSTLIGPGTAGIAMSVEDYESIPPEEWERGYRYELIHGVLVVTPPAGESHQSPNQYLGYLLLKYQEQHPSSQLDFTTIERQVRTSAGYRV